MRDTSFKKLPKSTRRLLRFSQWRLFITSFIIEIWPITGLIALFLGLGFLNAFSYIPSWAHALTLLGFAVGGVWLCRRAYKRLSWPAERDIMRQLEISSDVAHRPLNNLTDRLSHATNSATQKILWSQHLKKAREQLLRIRLLRPDKTLKQQDPYRLGFVALLICALGFYIAGSERQERLSYAVTFPESIAQRMVPTYTMPTAHLTAWISPPEHIQADPVYLHEGALNRDKTLYKYDAPEGSTLTLHASNVHYFPVFVYINDEKHKMVLNAEGHYSLDIPITEPVTIKLVQMFLLKAQWNITPTPDNPPSVTIHDDYTTNDRQEVEWSYKAEDDYGIVKLDMYVTPDFALQEKLRTAPLTEEEKKQFHLEIPLNSKQHVALIEEQRALDMTESAFAGQDVVLTMIAEDTNAQVGQSKAIKMTLPVRTFENPIAQKLIAARTTLAWSGKQTERTKIWRELQNISKNPASYRDDKTVFLALSVAHMSLERVITSSVPYDHLKKYEQWVYTLKNIRDILWDVALHLEEGNLSVVSRDLRDAIQNMAEQMKKGDMTEEEFKEMSQKLQETMAQYMQALGETLSEKFKDGQGQIPQDMMERLAQKMDAGSMFKQWQDLSNGGSKEDLQKMLDQMQEFLDQMDPERLKNAQPMDSKEFDDMKDLQKLIEEQQELIEQTQQEKDRQEQQKQSSGKPQELSQKQGEIRKKLGQVSKKIEDKIGEMPESLDKSGQAMVQAEDGLDKPDLVNGLKYEKEALAALQQGMDEEMDRMAKRLENVLNIGYMPGGPKGKGASDPLGRNGDGDEMDTSDVEIPEEKERRKVQEIMRELRERSNDYKRPQFEKEYIERLLKRF